MPIDYDRRTRILLKRKQIMNDMKMDKGDSIMRKFIIRSTNKQGQRKMPCPDFFDSAITALGWVKENRKKGLKYEIVLINIVDVLPILKLAEAWVS